MRRNTPKRATEMRAYALLRKAWLENHQTCERCYHRATEVHHKAGRDGWRLLAIELWAALCHDCHQYITEHPKQALAQGWSLSRVGAA
jgi:hypothetical protein